MQSLKISLIKALGPNIGGKVRSAARKLRLASNAYYDTQRFMRWSTTVRQPHLRSQMRAHLTFNYHKIEKGLALPDSRTGFGRDIILTLIEDIQAYESIFGFDDISVTVRDVLSEYRAEMRSSGTTITELDGFLEDPMPVARVGRKGGTISKNRSELFPTDPEVARRFITSRRSVRQFTGDAVPSEQIQRVVRMAQECPSVCNRQAGRAFASNDRETIDELLSFQNGNRGFGHLLGGLFVVGADLTRFQLVGERLQPYVDGGIFAMALAQALHAEGLGACMLNWSREKDQDQAIRRRFKLPETIVIITMIGFGYTPDRVRVAASPRDPDALQWLPF